MLSLQSQSPSAKSGEETSDGLDGQDASCPPSIDSEAVVPRDEQAPPQGRPRRSDPALSAVREGDLSERLHQHSISTSYVKIQPVNLLDHENQPTRRWCFNIIVKPVYMERRRIYYRQ